MKYKSGTFITVPNKEQLEQKINAIGQAVFLWLCSHADSETGRCFPSINRLAKLTHTSKNTVKNRLKILEKAGLIKIKREKREDGVRNKANIYTIVDLNKIGSGDDTGGSTDGSGGSGTDQRVGHEVGSNSSQEEQKTKNTPSGGDFLLDMPQEDVEQAFNVEETRDKWYDGDDEAFQLMAWYFDKKGLWRKFDSRGKLDAAAQRHLRAARQIVKGGWSERECRQAASKMFYTNPKMQDEWTLETLMKYLTK